MLKVISSENSRKFSTRQNINECKYCDFLQGKNGERENTKPWNTVLYETDNFVVVPTLGALVEGWLLIVTKQHLICMGAATNMLMCELDYVIGFATNVLTETYGQPTIFEHGPNQEGTGMGCGIDHAHIHLVPLKFSLFTEASLSQELCRLKWKICRGDMRGLAELYRRGKSYLYIKEPGSDAIYCTTEAIPCQSLRRVIAHKIGVGDKFDYKKHPFAGNVEKTLKAIKDRFSSVI